MATLVVVGVVLGIFWLASLVDVLTNNDNYENGSQLIWVLVVLLTGPLGAALYQMLGPDRSKAAAVERPGIRAALRAHREDR